MQVLPPRIFPLGIQRFLELEQRVSDLEETLEIIRDLVQTNNASLHGILDAINQAKGN